MSVRLSYFLSRAHTHSLSVGWVVLTGYAGEQLTCKVLDLAVWEGHKVVALQEVEDALAEEVHDDADVAAVIEAVTQMDASVPVLLVIGLESRQHTKFDLASIAILLNRSDDLYGDELVASLVLGLDHLAESALS